MFPRFLFFMWFGGGSISLVVGVFSEKNLFCVKLLVEFKKKNNEVFWLQSVFEMFVWLCQDRFIFLCTDTPAFACIFYAMLEFDFIRIMIDLLKNTEYLQISW